MICMFEFNKFDRKTLICLLITRHFASYDVVLHGYVMFFKKTLVYKKTLSCLHVSLIDFILGNPTTKDILYIYPSTYERVICR